MPTPPANHHKTDTPPRPSNDPVARLLEAIRERSPPQLAVIVKSIQSYLPGKEPVIELTRDPSLLIRALVAGKELLLATRQLPPPNQPLVLVIRDGKLSLELQPNPPAAIRQSPLHQQLQQLAPFIQRPLLSSIGQLLEQYPQLQARQSSPLSQTAQQAVERLLNQLPTPARLSSPEAVRSQLANSGLQLESRMALLSIANTATTPAAPPSNTTTNISGDLKGLLLNALQALGSSAAGTSEGGRTLLQWLQQLSPAARAGTATPYDSAPRASTLPPFPQFASISGIRSDAPATSAELSVTSLALQLASAAARIQTQQIQSLIQQQAPSADPNAPINTWFYELPIRNGQQLDSIQLLIEQYAQRDKKKERADKELRWQINLAFEVAPLAPFQALLSLVDNRAAITLWADAPQTLQLLGAHLGELRSALTSAGLEVEELRCKRGLPPPRETRLERSLVDIHT
ncbi:flagellar hook-length control protein FliK [Aestuariirhabdus litorea]|uniref:flagellar hook-length control protein FliK n=1 Tax=Aestuariirhabdus litorea TaxID=2528527 RepID=UPI0013E2B467|nr:flagellar hook-length control protein FliK [Aestuariirhabdus litorea]